MKKTLFLIILFTTTYHGISQELLRYNLKVGDTFTLLQEASQEIIQELPGRQQIINNNLTGLLHFNVTEATPEIYVVEISFKRFAIKMSSPSLGEMMSVDTNEASEDVEFKMFQGMLDKPMEMVMKPTGEIIEIRNGDVIIEGMLTNMGELDDLTRDMMRTQLEKEWKAEVLSKSFEQMTFIYPDTSKNIGDTWANSFTGEGKINAENVWTYKSTEDNTRTLTADSNITVNLSTEAITMKLSGDQTTETTANKVNGFVQKQLVKSSATGNAVMPQSPEMTIPTTINSTTTYTLQ